MNSDNLGFDLDDDKDLKELIVTEQQKLHFQQQINRLNDICWEKCVSDKLGSKLDKKTEYCLGNCVGRFIDTTLFITKRFASMLQKPEL